jgi:hypothetical protein
MDWSRGVSMAFHLGGYCICFPAKKQKQRKDDAYRRTADNAYGQLTLKHLNIQSENKKRDNLIDAAKFFVNTILKDWWLLERAQSNKNNFFLLSCPAVALLALLLPFSCPSAARQSLVLPGITSQIATQATWELRPWTGALRKRAEQRSGINKLLLFKIFKQNLHQRQVISKESFPISKSNFSIKGLLPIQKLVRSGKSSINRSECIICLEVTAVWKWHV